MIATTSRDSSLGTPSVLECAGTGLVALDILVGGQTEHWPATAGGSCANVLTILSYLGWTTHPIAYLGEDEAAHRVLRDMERWGVMTSLVRLGRKSGTPIIIERLERLRGLSSHKFEFVCPNCRSPLPRSRPVPIDVASTMEPNLPKAAVYYFDRASKTALKLASHYRENASLIVFEPPRLRTDKIFRHCLRLAHVVKYSYEQIDKIHTSFSIPLEIQTLGAEGLRYRISLHGRRSRVWRKIPAFNVLEHVDSAGAGDWCTAGIVHLLGRAGFESLRKATREQVEYALRFGQALAGLKCSYEGPRGLMYEKPSKDAVKEATRLINGGSLEQMGGTTVSPSGIKVLREVCKSCASKSLSGLTNERFTSIPHLPSR